MGCYFSKNYNNITYPIDSEDSPADYYLNDDYDSEEDINGTYDENQKK